MCIGWDIASASVVQVQMNNTAQRNPDYNIANFDVIKLPCFRGMFLHPPQWWHDFCTGAIINTSCLSGQVTNESSELRSLSEISNMSASSVTPSNHGA